MLHYLVALLTILGAHRIWNYEDVFAGARMRLKIAQARLGRASGLLTPVLCPACNPVWIGVVVGAVAWACGALGPWTAATLPLAAYPFVRGAVWLYTQTWSPQSYPAARPASPPPVAATCRTGGPSKPSAAPAEAPTVGDAGGVRQIAPKCTSCAENTKRMAAERAFSDGFDQRVVLLTALAAWDTSYSLVSVILDQARMLARNPRRLVCLWVMESADLAKAPTDLPPNVIIRPYVPNTAWREDVIDDAGAKKLVNQLQMRLFNLGNATVITHDLLLVSWYATFAKALHQLGKLKAFAWIHQIHSCTGSRPPEAVAQYRAALPPGHMLAVVSPTEVASAALYYQTTVDRVMVLPNARDLQSFGATPHATALLQRTGLLQADIAQTFPLSSPRMESKGIMRAVRTMAALHRAGRSTHLLVAEAHATGPAAELRRRGVRGVAAQAGLPPEALSFSAEVLPETAQYGLDAQTVRQLLQASNVFIFPSISESAGLVALEAGLCGNLLVLNKNVPALQHLLSMTGTGIPWSFPAVRAPEVREPVDADYDALAADIQSVLQPSPARRLQRVFGFDAVAQQTETSLALAKPIV